MKKYLFWLSTVALIISNLFWAYETLDNAVGRDYYKVSCEEYLNDRNNFKTIVDSIETKNKLIAFLTKNNIRFEGFDKEDNYVIDFNSFQ